MWLGQISWHCGRNQNESGQSHARWDGHGSSKWTAVKFEVRCFLC